MTLGPFSAVPARDRGHTWHLGAATGTKQLDSLFNWIFHSCPFHFLHHWHKQKTRGFPPPSPPSCSLSSNPFVASTLSPPGSQRASSLDHSSSWNKPGGVAWPNVNVLAALATGSVRVRLYPMFSEPENHNHDLGGTPPRPCLHWKRPRDATVNINSSKEFCTGREDVPAPMHLSTVDLSTVDQVVSFCIQVTGFWNKDHDSDILSMGVSREV